MQFMSTSTVLVYFRLTYIWWSTLFNSSLASYKDSFMLAHYLVYLVQEDFGFKNILLHKVNVNCFHAISRRAYYKFVFSYKRHRTAFMLCYDTLDVSY